MVPRFVALLKRCGSRTGGDTSKTVKRRSRLVIQSAQRLSTRFLFVLLPRSFATSLLPSPIKSWNFEDLAGR